ncbi:MAG TPA: hypothetical protein VFE54_01955, partial [Mucilaginibacter sp.]|nr:hypothetical protein [Mucilaginibacter sp.]
DFIFQMRENPNTLKIDELKNRAISIDFELLIPKLDQWDLAQSIAGASRAFLENKIVEDEPTFF